MSRVLWVALMLWGIITLSVLTAHGAPFLVCNWQSGITSSEVEVNGVVVSGTTTQSGADMILLDLAGYSNGSYTFRARWTGTGGWPSDWSIPFDAVKPASGGVLRIRK